LARASFLSNGRANLCVAAASLGTIFAFIGLALFARRQARRPATPTLLPGFAGSKANRKPLIEKESAS